MPTAHPSILIVEDDPDVLESTLLLLEEEGFHLRPAKALDEARAALAEGVPGVALVDLSLNGDVPGFIRELKAAGCGLVLLFSAGDRLSERAQAYGADGAVPKPFDVDRLVALLRAAPGGESHVSA